MKSSTSSALVLLVVILGLSTAPNVESSHDDRPQKLTVYVFRKYNVPNTTIQYIYPDLVPPQPFPIGGASVSVEDSIVRKTASNTSEQLGTSRLIQSVGFRETDYFRSQGIGLLDLNTTNYVGTISFSGIVSIGVFTPPIEELSITGGTGAFRMARGYILTSTVFADFQVEIIQTVKYDISLFYD